jgi:hypothetical protein
MSSEKPPRRRRGTPITDNLSADLQTLGSILANHTRGLDDFLQRQAQHIEQRHQILLAETPGFLLPPDLNLDAMSKDELKELCRIKLLRGWSKLNRADLLAFLKQELGPEIEAMRLLRQDPAVGTPKEEEEANPTPPADASRIERLLLLLLRHLDVPPEQVEAAWQNGPIA